MARIIGVIFFAMIITIFLLAGCFNNHQDPGKDYTIPDNLRRIQVKYSNSTEGCIEEGYHLITPGIEQEWKTRSELKCCEGLTKISEAEYPRLFTEDCVPAEGTGYLCSNCGNGICEEWESRCSCKEDCKGGCELGNTGGCNRSCGSDLDCQEVCGAGCINIHEAFDDKGVDASCKPMWCHCVDGICSDT